MKSNNLKNTTDAGQDTVVLDAPGGNNEAVNDFFAQEGSATNYIPEQTEKQHQQQAETPQPPSQERGVDERSFSPAGIQSGFAAPAVQQSGVSYKVFRLAHGSRKGKVNLHCVDDVVNPKTGRVERVRLIRGVPSIWSSDQKDLDKNYIETNIRQLVFEDRTLRVPTHDDAALEFLSLCNHNIDNPKKIKPSKYEFFEWNPKRQAEAQLLKRKKRIEAIQKALTVPEAEMRKHALYLNVSFTDELGEPFTAEGLRNEYMLKAEEKPEEFLNSLGSVLVDISYNVKSAIRDSRIDLGRQQNQAFWADGGFIAQIPQNRQAQDYLIELANTNSEQGRAFKERLQMMMGK